MLQDSIGLFPWQLDWRTAVAAIVFVYALKATAAFFAY